MNSLDAFEKKTLSEIKKIFPLLPDKIINFVYFQLGEKQMTISYLKQKYQNFVNEDNQQWIN